MESPFRTILVPIDAQEPERGPLELAAALAERCDAEIVALLVLTIGIERDLVDRGATAGPPDSDRAMAEQRAKAVVEGLAAELPNPSVPLQLACRRGEDVSAAILAHCDEVAADLVVMGTHGRRGLERLAMGSVAERVVRECRSPVLTLRPREG